MKEAYEFVNRDRLRQEAAERAVRSAEAARRGKSHLHSTRTGMGAGSDVTITQEELYWYQQLNPGATREQIQKFANRQKK